MLAVTRIYQYKHNLAGMIKVEGKDIAPAPDLESMRTQLANNLSTQALGRLLEELRASQNIQLRDFDDVRKDAMNVIQ